MKEFPDRPHTLIFLKTAKGFTCLSVEEIILFRANGHKIECVTVKSETPLQIYHSLGELGKKYSEKLFWRCNKSVIVNSTHIKTLDTKVKELHLNDGTVLKVTENFIKLFKSHTYYKDDKTIKRIMSRNRKCNILKIMRIKRYRHRFNRIKEVFKKVIRFNKTYFLIFLSIIFVLMISRCESPERFYRPDLPERLCTIGIIDVDDTTLRHISFEKSFQSEYPGELDDSLRDFYFSISSSNDETFRYQCDSTVKSVNNLRIPDGILFNSKDKYYLYAKEKDLEVITAEVIASEPPSQPRLNSTTVLNTTLSEPAGCGEILDVRTLLINTAIEKNENLYYAILVRAWGFTHSSAFLPWPGFVDFSVIEGNTPGFLTALKGSETYHYICDSIPRPGKKDPTYAYFIEGNKIAGKDCILTLSVQYRDGHCLFEAIKAVSIIVISIPHELYQFEKGVYTYRKTVDDPFAEPIYVNGNIKGGNGIFALCRSKELKMTFYPWI